MTNRLFPVLTLALLSSGPFLQAQSPGKKPKPAGVIVEGDVGKQLDELLLATDKADGGFCGVALVASKGKVLLQKGYGIADAEGNKPMPPDALYDWASVTKQFTATAMLRLIDASRLDDAGLRKLPARKVADAQHNKKWRKLSLDDPLSRFYPDVARDKAAVTLRQLLNHTSGIESGFKNDWKFDAQDRDSLMKLVLGLPMTSKPGEKWDYSNSAYAFVAGLIEVITEMSFEDYCDEMLWKPAGMKSATQIGRPNLDLARVPKIDRGKGFPDRPKDLAFAYGNKMNWGYRGCGGVVAPTEDMLAWDRALRDPKFLSKESLEELYKPALNKYALGWEIEGKRAEHSGGVRGVVTYYLRHLERDYVVALACTYTPKAHPKLTANQLAKVVEGGG
jgi:CubicO group peptidase (beta-lactamase class C family)